MTDWPREGPLLSLEVTEHLIRAVGPQNIAAVITEPMFGAAGLYPHADYPPPVSRHSPVSAASCG